MAELDIKGVLWLNQWVGSYPWIDGIVQVLVSDYFFPVVFSLILLGLWFVASSRPDRDRLQRAVIVAGISLGIASLIVALINDHYFRPRPFAQHEIQLLFYQPTDSSFPANPIAVVFAVASSVWSGHRSLGFFLYISAMLFALTRVYAGAFYPVDVLAGAAIGIATAIAIRRVLALIEPIPTYALKLARFLCLG